MALAQVRFGVNPWAALPIAIALSALVGFLIGLLSFRRGCAAPTSRW